MMNATLYFLGFSLAAFLVWEGWHYLQNRANAWDPDAPSPEEIEEVKRLRASGGFRLHSKSSAVVRHFETPTQHSTFYSTGCRSPNSESASAVQSWRERENEVAAIKGAARDTYSPGGHRPTRFRRARR